jgi:hypothetical protein
MNRKRSFPGLILVNLLILVFMSATVPLRNSDMLESSSGQSELVALKIENDSTSYAYIWLDGPAFYYLVVKPEETKTFTVKRGEYDKEVSYCGAKDSNTIDLTTHTRLIMPVCGANARHEPSSPHIVNITNTIKIVKVTLKNDTTTSVLAILEGPSTYVFSLAKEEVKDYTIAKGDYDVRYYACGKVGAKEFSAFHNEGLRFKCP